MTEAIQNVPGQPSTSPHALSTLFRGGDMAHQLADATS